MRVGIVTALVLLSSVEAAVAQGVQDDPRRRRLVLPSVREATDCIARETLNEPGIEGATRPGQFRAALAQPMRRCADEVDAMIAAHDQVYYPGYGEAFSKGPICRTSRGPSKSGSVPNSRAAPRKPRNAPRPHNNRTPAFRSLSRLQSRSIRTLSRLSARRKSARSAKSTRCGSGPAKRTLHPRRHPRRSPRQVHRRRIRTRNRPRPISQEAEAQPSAGSSRW